MSCESHHLGMNYVQVTPGKEPEMKSWCFTCSKRPDKRVDAPSADTKPIAATAVKRTPRSKNGV